MNTNSRKYNQYKAQAVYDNSGWNDLTKSSYKADSGMSCLITVIIAISLIAACAYYFGLF